MGELNTAMATDIIRGIGEGCVQAGCALIGGETAEMPGMYQPGEYDLAGFAVGMVDNADILDGSAIHVGDRIIGIASNGLHSNGYSLVRKICFEVMKLSCDEHIPELGCSLGEELLRPTRIYAETIRQLIRALPVRGLAHITGGGLVENLLRIIPRACQVVLQKGSWEIPPIFSFLQEGGQVADEEMMLAFNNGIGLVAVVPEDSTSEVISRLEALGEKVFLIGEITECRSEEKKCEWV
jgi:phosphoribosylformylglycinamidine cyclo-ligase